MFAEVVDMLAQNSLTDWHCHLLPSIDDGPSTVDEAVEMAGALADAGFTTVCCTPHHIKGVYDTTPAMVREATGRLQEQLARACIPLTLVPGIEYYLDEFLAGMLTEPLLLPGNLLLVDASPCCDQRFLTETLYTIVRKGITPLIAHPERNEVFSPAPIAKESGLSRFLRFIAPGAHRKMKGPASDGSMVEDAPLFSCLKGMGCKFQGDIGSFAGLYGERVRRKAGFFRDAGLYSYYGSDLHSSRHKNILCVRESLNQ